jgi:organic hydroperoxide reductase OsmC/OhrA
MAGTVSPRSDGGRYGSRVAVRRAKRFEYTAEIGNAGEISAAGETPLALPASLTPEHLVLAGLGRCSIASLEYHAGRAGIDVAAAASASGAVTRRAQGERYAFVEVECRVDATVEPAPSDEAALELVARAQRGCFVGASLDPRPAYRWRINGAEVSSR